MVGGVSKGRGSLLSQIHLWGPGLTHLQDAGCVDGSRPGASDIPPPGARVVGGSGNSGPRVPALSPRPIRSHRTQAALRVLHGPPATPFSPLSRGLRPRPSQLRLIPWQDTPPTHQPRAPLDTRGACVHRRPPWASAGRLLLGCGHSLPTRRGRPVLPPTASQGRAPCTTV